MISQDAIDYGIIIVNDDYKIRHAFTTLNGSWDPNGERWSIPQWARDLYLLPFGHPNWFDDAGGDHHFFIRIEGERDDGKPSIKEYQLLNTDGRITVFKTKEHSGWANQPVFNSTQGDGNPSQLQWFIRGDHTPVVRGGGMPHNHHVSCFVVLEPNENTDIPDGPDLPDSDLRVTVEDRTVLIYSDGDPFNIEVI